MAGERLSIKRGQILEVKAVHSGTKQDGEEWQQVHVSDESGKIEVGFFLNNPITGLREGDHIVVDEVEFLAKRTGNRHAYNTKTWQKLEMPKKFINEATPQLTCHLAEGGGFGGGAMPDGGFGEGGFGGGDFNTDDGDLPF